MVLEYGQDTKTKDLLKQPWDGDYQKLLTLQKLKLRCAAWQSNIHARQLTQRWVVTYDASAGQSFPTLGSGAPNLGHP